MTQTHNEPFASPATTTSLKKWVSSERVLGGSGPKTHWGMHLLDKIMILQGIKLTIQPLGVGYANRPKKAQNGGVCGMLLYRTKSPPPTLEVGGVGGGGRGGVGEVGGGGMGGEGGAHTRRNTQKAACAHRRSLVI